MPIQSVLFSYSGRINRFEFWIKGVVAGVALTLVLEIIAILLASVSETVGDIAFWAILPVYIWMFFAVVAKRCHDRGGSGWWGLLTLVPFIGTLYFIIACGILSGDPYDNRYGPKP